MEENFEQLRADLLKKDQILITCFSFLIGDDTFFRFYFTDLTNRFVWNPITEDSNGKKSFPIYAEYNEGLVVAVRSAQVYVSRGRKFPSPGQG